MESTALSVGKSVLNATIGYARSALAEEVSLQLGVRRDQVFITNELEMMQAFLMAAHSERDDDDRVVKVWVKQVRDVAYNVEDTIQEFAICLEKHSSWWCIHRTLLDRRHVAKQMKELRANVEDVSERNMRYQLIKGSGSKPAPMGTGHSDVGSATMCGTEEARRQQDKAKVELVKLISKKDDKLRVIAMSGTSNTLLGEASIIKRVYEDPNIRNKFGCRAWISVMFPFSLVEFLHIIVEQFHGNFLHESREKDKATLEVQVLRKMGLMKEDDLVDEFIRYMKEKSYLIVINGIHSIEEWNHIKPCFQNNNKGSRIIVSAERLGIASLCVGPEDAAPEYEKLLVDESLLYAFYEKSSQDGKNSMEARLSSYTETDNSDSAAEGKMLSRTETMLRAFKEYNLIGRDTEKLDIIKLIANEDSNQLEVIGVFGMGGLGKTTLIRDVYRSQELSGMFQKHACVTLMRPFDLDKLLKDIATQLGFCVADMSRKLEPMKYLIILDDLSSNAEWNTIIPHFPAMETSSRIIVTTRIKGIARHCSKKHENIYELQSLRHNNACDLFMKKVFGKTTNLDEQYPELVEHANKILKKCNGLPLAIVAIGGFLATQPKTALIWRHLNEHISAELEMNPELETIRTVIIKSFDGLPYHLKACFLYVSIFPEDHKIRLKRLLRRWIAEGYSGVVCNKSAEVIAESYLMELISRSMLVPSEKSFDSREGIEFCQVHDIIREIVISMSIEENLVFRLEEGCFSLNTQQRTTRHLAINGNWQGDKSEFKSIVDMSCVRSVTVFGEWKPFFISDKMRFLRVLDLEDSTGLCDHHLDHIGKFLHLRYFSLRGCGGIHHLPDSLGNLRQLETLDVRGTKILEMPKSIVKLRKLNCLRAGTTELHLYGSCGEEIPDVLRSCFSAIESVALCCIFCCIIDQCRAFCWMVSSIFEQDMCYHGVVMPKGTRKLNAMRTLGIVKLGKHVLKDIKRLTRLRKLGVTGVNRENGQELCSTIVGLRQLESLFIGSEGRQGLCGCLDEMSSSSPENLRSLKLYGRLKKLPEWVKGLKNLVKLKLQDSSILEHDVAIQVLGDLPNLALLHLLTESMVGKEISLNFTREVVGGNLPNLLFPSLVVLEVGLAPNLKSVKFEGAAPMLELIRLAKPTCYESKPTYTQEGLSSRVDCFSLIWSFHSPEFS
uniref:Uncharacterized protein n=1 Tax=Avena sativa TaxID=4498 RepID=A0ACD5TZ34_AVESA